MLPHYETSTRTPVSGMQFGSVFQAHSVIKI